MINAEPETRGKGDNLQAAELNLLVTGGAQPKWSSVSTRIAFNNKANGGSISSSSTSICAYSAHQSIRQSGARSANCLLRIRVHPIASNPTSKILRATKTTSCGWIAEFAARVCRSPSLAYAGGSR